jgi:hypothetical protein
MTEGTIVTLLLAVLGRAGLLRFEDILGEQVASLEKRLDVARRDLELFPGTSGRELASLLRSIAEDVRTGTITRTVLSSPEIVRLLRKTGWLLPESVDLSVRGGLPGKEDFNPWERPDKQSKGARLDEEAALPGREDFEPWSDEEDENR